MTPDPVPPRPPPPAPLARRRRLRRAAVAVPSALALCTALWAAGGCQQMAAAQAAQSAVPAAQAAMQTAQTTVQGAGQTAQAAIVGAQNFVNGIPGAQLAFSAIPQAVKDAVSNLLNSNKVDLGKPKSVFVFDGMYILTYPGAGPFGTGQPRYVVIDTIGYIARLQRLEKKGY